VVISLNGIRRTIIESKRSNRGVVGFKPDLYLRDENFLCKDLKGPRGRGGGNATLEKENRSKMPLTLAPQRFAFMGWRPEEGCC